LDHFRNANHRSEIADNNSYELWNEENRPTTEKRAYNRWKEMLVQYESPPLDEVIDEALRMFITEKKASIPDEWY
jgi:trimethylamine--corrinoid protein Co-methyltransferase|tara:strand:- start:163 stop:387 length:225 start_codon:yes stop_codon:yes gene_type:complete